MTADREVDPLVRILIRMRVRKGLSQREIGRRIGTSSASVCDWERGLHEPMLSNLNAWAAALGYFVILWPASETSTR